MMQPSTTSGAVAKPNSSAPEQRADHHVAAGLHLAVDLHRDAAAQAVQHQRLLRFGEPQFPRRAGVLDRRPRRSAGAAVVAGDRHVIGLGLGHAGGNRADADLGHQLDADRRPRIGVLQIVDQLRQVFDRINVVMRRRRNQFRRPASNSAASAMYSDTLRPGSWPPSPGLAPCAILIWICSADARYSAVTPKRPDATCLIFDFSEVAFLQRRCRFDTGPCPSRDASVSPAFTGA